MFDDMVSLGDRLARLVQELDPDRVSGPHARRLWEALDRVEKLAAAGKTLLARRLADTHRPDQEGVRSAAEALARRSGTTVGAARDAVDTSTRLPGLPRLEAAMRRGDLSQAQAALVGAAAAADPSAEQHLVALAARASLPELREECARVRAAADPDPQAANERLHRARRLRRFTDPDGAWTLIAKGTPQAGAAFNAVLDPIIEHVFHAARRAGRREPQEAYAFDALMEMANRADTSTAGLRATAAGRCHPAPAPGCGGAGDGAGADDGVPANGAADNGAAVNGAAVNGAAVNGAAVNGAAVDPGTIAPIAGAAFAGAPIDGAPTLFDPAPDATPTDGAPADRGPVAAEPNARAPAGPTEGGSVAGGRSAGGPPLSEPPGRSNPRFLALLRVDLEALRRGTVAGNELCEISGVGPVPVSVARGLLGDAVLKLVITRGVDVCHVTHLGRGPTAAQKVALAWTSPGCTVEGCYRSRVEYDHREDYARTRRTRLDELDPLCEFHHDLKTRHNWALVPGIGKRPMVGPDDSRHPRHRTKARPTGVPTSAAAPRSHTTAPTTARPRPAPTGPAPQPP
jgi:hypothetical protein